MENFLIQLSRYHEFKLNSTEQFPDDIFNLERSKKLLDELIKFIPAEPKKNITSK